MSVAIQIRDVPEEIRDLLADQAKQRGQSMQAYLLDVVTREARFGRKLDVFWPAPETMIDLEASGFDVVAVIREGRDHGFDVDRAEYDG